MPQALSELFGRRIELEDGHADATGEPQPDPNPEVQNATEDDGYDWGMVFDEDSQSV